MAGRVVTVVCLDSARYAQSGPLGGNAQRMRDLARALAAHGLRVVLTSSAPADDLPAGIEWRDSGTRAAPRCDVWIGTEGSDPAVILDARRAGARIVIENQPPIEQLDYPEVNGQPDGAERYRAMVDEFRLHAAVADLLIARSDAEHAALLGAVVALGPDSASAQELDRRAIVVPIGCSQADVLNGQEPAPDAPLVWNGGVWNYLDPLPLAEAVANVHSHDRRARLVFTYPPDPTSSARRRLAELADRQPGAIVVNQHAPYDTRQRDDRLRGARAFVCFGRASAENTTCHRLRLRECFVHTVPFLADSYGATGSYVTRLGIGVAADTDRAHLVAAVRRVLDPCAHADMRRAITAVRPSLIFETTVEPLVDWIRAGHRRVNVDERQLCRLVERNPRWLVPR